MKHADTHQTDAGKDVAESLSVAIDGELSREQLRFLLRRLDHDPELQQTWTRYHVARDGLRRQLPPLADAGFAERVMLAIGAESAPAATTTRRSHWLHWSTGGVIAASVAAAALMLGQPTGDAERMTAAVAQPDHAVAVAASAGKPAIPAVVPPWLSGNSAGLLSQRASATLGAPFGSNSNYARRLPVYPPMHRYRTLDNNDGSYLLLLDPEQQAAPGTAGRAATTAQ
jgi:sigma-E factor negative regulatory protein RseA